MMCVTPPSREEEAEGGEEEDEETRLGASGYGAGYGGSGGYGSKQTTKAVKALLSKDKVALEAARNEVKELRGKLAAKTKTKASKGADRKVECCVTKGLTMTTPKCDTAKRANSAECRAYNTAKARLLNF